MRAMQFVFQCEMLKINSLVCKVTAGLGPKFKKKYEVRQTYDKLY
jgi:hypothetical protein